MTNPSGAEYLDSLPACVAELDALYAQCVEAYPEFDLTPADFREAVIGAIDKFLAGLGAGSGKPSAQDIGKFIGGLQGVDLYLTIACARGNERAWWHFDRQYRSFIERLARGLVGSWTDANELIDCVYGELFGIRTVAGVRQSKFKTYTGRGSLRGWLRVVTWHAAVDLYRRRPAEVPLEDWSTLGDDTRERQALRTDLRGTEDVMLENVIRERYRSATAKALDRSLANLDDHETLLLLYYHVERLTLREIARIVEQPSSPIRLWFQRKRGHTNRVHESTVMRWLEKVYGKVLDRFRATLQDEHGLNASEIEICIAIAAKDPGQTMGFDLGDTGNESDTKRAVRRASNEGTQ